MLDIIIILFIIYGIYKGKKKGAIKSILRFIGNIISLIFTYILVRPITHYLVDEYQINEIFKSQLIKINPQLENTVQQGTEATLKSNDFYNQLPEFLQGNISGQLSSNINSSLIDALSFSLSYIFTFIVLFMIMRFVISFIINIIIKTFDLPILREMNKLLGMVFYALHSFIIGVFVTMFIQIVIIYQNLPISSNSYILNYIFTFFNNLL